MSAAGQALEELLARIPIADSSVPGCGCAGACPAALYAHRLERQWHQDQRTILELRAQVEGLTRVATIRTKSC